MRTKHSGKDKQAMKSENLKKSVVYLFREAFIAQGNPAGGRPEIKEISIY